MITNVEMEVESLRDSRVPIRLVSGEDFLIQPEGMLYQWILHFNQVIATLSDEESIEIAREPDLKERSVDYVIDLDKNRDRYGNIRQTQVFFKVMSPQGWILVEALVYPSNVSHRGRNVNVLRQEVYDHLIDLRQAESLPLPETHVA